MIFRVLILAAIGTMLPHLTFATAYPGDRTDYSRLQTAFAAQQSIDTSLAEDLNSKENARALDQIIKSKESLNKVKLLHLGITALPERLKLIEEAQNYIFISMPYWEKDEEGIRLIQAIEQRKDELKKIGRNLDVRLMHDWTTGAGAKDYSGNNFMKLLDGMTDGNSLGWNSLWDMRSWSFNIPKHRLHEKLFVVDGKHLMMGGINFARTYLQGGLTENGWHDTDLHIEGPAAQVAAKAILKPWLFQKYIEKTYSPLPSTEKEFTELLQNYFYRDQSEHTFSGLYYPEGQENNTPEWQTFNIDFGLQDLMKNPKYFPAFSENSEFNTPVRIIYDNPLVDINTKTGESYSKMAEAIRFVAKRAKHSLKIYCPYATFTDEFLKIMTDAAERGIKVQIITNSRDSIDVFKALAVAVLPNYSKLLAAGAEIYEWQGHNQLKKFYEEKGCKNPTYWPGGTLHSKAFIVDDAVVFMGSSNFNYRSELLNSESMTLVRSPRIAKEMAAVFAADIADTQLPDEQRKVDCDGGTVDYRPSRLLPVTKERVDRELKENKTEADFLRHFRFIL